DRDPRSERGPVAGSRPGNGCAYHTQVLKDRVLRTGPRISGAGKDGEVPAKVLYKGLVAWTRREHCVGRPAYLTFANGYDGDGKVAKLYYGPTGEAELVTMLRTVTR
ncbi:MAG TPA: hypothetical protein VFT63_05715, partial [bacterium]|nr:hypothetical protein [bacterium]